MTLGQTSSLLLLSSLTLLAGCAFGDVSGTGTRDPDRSSFSNPDEPTNTGGTSQTGGPTEPAAVEGPVDYEALFDAPADPTTTDDLVTGVWAGKTYYADVRLKITANKIIIATKCDGYSASGIEFGAVVTETQIKVLASKSTDGSGYGCGIKVSPMVIQRCASDSDSDCFDVAGVSLVFEYASLFTSDSGSTSSRSVYTKLSD